MNPGKQDGPDSTYSGPEKKFLHHRKQDKKSTAADPKEHPQQYIDIPLSQFRCLICPIRSKGQAPRFLVIISLKAMVTIVTAAAHADNVAVGRLHDPLRQRSSGSSGKSPLCRRPGHDHLGGQLVASLITGIHFDDDQLTSPLDHMRLRNSLVHRDAAQEIDLVLHTDQ